MGGDGMIGDGDGAVAVLASGNRYGRMVYALWR